MDAARDRSTTDGIANESVTRRRPLTIYTIKIGAIGRCIGRRDTGNGIVPAIDNASTWRGYPNKRRSCRTRGVIYGSRN